MSNPDHQSRWVGDLYGEFQFAESGEKAGFLSYLPGLLLVAVVALAALWLSENYGPPAILMGLLIGLALNFVNRDRRLANGLNLSSQTLLRIGIVLVGMRISFGEISSLGLVPFIALGAIMISVLLTGLLAAKLLKQDVLFGLLAGGATAICGASAALALWSIIGEKRIDQSRFTIVLLGTTLASSLAMMFYPSVALLLELNDRQAGFLIGAAIHDVAQAIGGGFAYSSEAGEVATVVKLSRVAMLAPMVAIVALVLRNLGNDEAAPTQRKIGLTQAIPWFVIGFVALVAVNSFVSIPAAIAYPVNSATRILLLCAVIAAAIKSDMSGIMSHGIRAFGPVIMTTAAAFVLSLFAAKLL